MKTQTLSSSSGVVRLSSSSEPVQVKNADENVVALDGGTEEVHDSFEQANGAPKIKYRHVFKEAKAMWGTPLEEPVVVPIERSKAIAKEEKFIKAPTVRAFFRLAKDFDSTMRTVGHSKYSFNDDISVKMNKTSLEALDLVIKPKKEREMEYWHRKQTIKFDYQHTTAELKAERRHHKIQEKGLGYAGRMSEKVASAKEASFFAKNNLTIRGNVFKLTHKTCPKNIYEIMPRYGYRKSAHIGVRVTQFALTTILTGLGYALMPATFGISKIVTDHVRTIITLSGEVITHKIAGADNHKCIVHAGLRGVQLEIPRCIPIAGDVVNIGEGIAFGGAAMGIVSTTLADMILAHHSDCYVSKINLDDLGDSRCLAELNNRIDYLSQFLLPYGQYLLLKETNLVKRKQLKTELKEKFTLLRDLEKKKVNSLNFYRLGLAAERIPTSREEQIRKDCEAALLDMRLNTHRIVKKCLANLMANDPELKYDLHDELVRLDQDGEDVVDTTTALVV